MSHTTTIAALGIVAWPIACAAAVVLVLDMRGGES